MASVEIPVRLPQTMRHPMVDTFCRYVHMELELVEHSSCLGVKDDADGTTMASIDILAILFFLYGIVQVLESFIPSIISLKYFYPYCL